MLDYFEQEIFPRKTLELWENIYTKYCLEFDKAVILDWGCHWGYLIKHIQETFSPSLLIGNDINEYWSKLQKKHGWDYKKSNNIRFTLGELNDIEIPSHRKLDYILCSYTLQYMHVEQLCMNLKQAYSLLKPGGMLICCIQLYGSCNNNDNTQWFNLSYLHIITGSRKISKFLKNKGISYPYINYLTPSSYFAIFAQIGFEVLNYDLKMSLSKDNYEKDYYEYLQTEKSWTSDEELMCNEMFVQLVKPIEANELEIIAPIIRTTNWDIL